MSGAQRTIIFLGLLMVGDLCLLPPYQWEHSTYVFSDSHVPHKVDVQTASIGHCWIWDPPKGWNESVAWNERKSHIAAIDWPGFGIYVGLTLVVSLFFAFVAFGRKPVVVTWQK